MRVLSALLVAGALAHAQVAPEPASYRILDGGYVRSFEVARDELRVVTRSGRHEFRRIPATASVSELKHYAASLRRATGEEADLILYESGARRNEYTRRVLTREVLVTLEPGADAGAAAKAAGAVSVRELDFAPAFFLFAAAGTGGALDLADALRGAPGVLSAEPMLARQQQKKSVPNDTLFTNQWHLLNTGQNGGTAGIDVNVTNVWNTFRGTNLLIAIVDDGLQTTHTDLWENVNTAIDWDWNGNDADPSPDVSIDDHGTACAGVAAARGNNGRGVSGAVPEATLVGLRLISSTASDAEEAEAMAHSNGVIFVKSNSWGPSDDGETLEGPGTLTTNALRQGALTGRGGKGTLYVWAGGNGLESEDNANYDGYANSIYTIACAALSDQGYQASYSEPGACLVVTAPSSSFTPDRQGITTTDLMGENGYNYAGAPDELADVNYTKTFGGTSSATPLAAGVVALMLQANTNLGWRDVQEILIRSATKVSPADTDWRTNSAGFHFNHKYGAGLINAQAAVSLALTWTNLGAQASWVSSQTGLSLAIPDNNPVGVTRTFDLSGANLRVEHVTLNVTITHPYRGDLAITLVSPNGMTSRLAEAHGDAGTNYPNWKFSSVRHWGEDSAGTWTLRIADEGAADTGTVTSLRLEVLGVMGSNSPPVLAPIGNQSVTVSNLLQFDVVATDAADGDPVALFATNVPAWATFSTVTNAGGVTNTFSGTPAAAGTYSVTFFAGDKDGTNSETIAITVSALGSVWINELDYNQSGVDVNEWVELAGAAGVSLDDYELVFIDQLGVEYNTVDLAGASWVFGNETNGYGFAVIGKVAPADGLADYTPAGWVSDEIQNGSDDSVQLRKKAGPENVHLFDYAGNNTTTAEDQATPLTDGNASKNTLFLTGGPGSGFTDFYWTNTSGKATPGGVNFAQLLVRAGDTDSDGLPDSWEQQYFTNLAQTATNDYDGDGFNNGSEYIADTVPTQSNSFLAVIAISNFNARFITVASSTARVYTVQYTADLLPGNSWSNLASALGGTNGTVSMADTNEAERRMYRVRVTLP